MCSIQENHEVRGPGREGSTDLYCIAWLAPEVSGAPSARTHLTDNSNDTVNCSHYYL